VDEHDGNAIPVVGTHHSQPAVAIHAEITGEGAPAFDLPGPRLREAEGQGRGGLELERDLLVAELDRGRVVQGEDA